MGEFDQLVVNSLYLIDQRAITIAMNLDLEKRVYLGDSGFCVFVLAFIIVLRFSCCTRLNYRLYIISDCEVVTSTTLSMCCTTIGTII